MEFYCVKCRTSRDIEEMEEIIMKNGKPAMQAKCPICSTKVFRVGVVRIMEETIMEAFEPPPGDTNEDRRRRFEPPPV